MRADEIEVLREPLEVVPQVGDVTHHLVGVLFDLHAAHAEHDHLQVGDERRRRHGKHAPLVRVLEERAGPPARELVVHGFDRHVHEGEVVGAFRRPDVLGGDRIDLLLHVSREFLLVALLVELRLGFDDPVVVVERELRVDRNQLPDPDDGVDAGAVREGVLDRVRGRWKAVAQEVLEQQLSEPAARLRRPQRLLEPAEILRSVEHLPRRVSDLAEPFVNPLRRLRRVP